MQEIGSIPILSDAIEMGQGLFEIINWFYQEIKFYAIQFSVFLSQHKMAASIIMGCLVIIMVFGEVWPAATGGEQLIIAGMPLSFSYYLTGSHGVAIVGDYHDYFGTNVTFSELGLARVGAVLPAPLIRRYLTLTIDDLFWLAHPSAMGIWRDESCRQLAEDIHGATPGQYIINEYYYPANAGSFWANPGVKIMRWVDIVATDAFRALMQSWLLTGGGGTGGGGGGFGDGPVGVQPGEEWIHYCDAAEIVETRWLNGTTEAEMASYLVDLYQNSTFAPNEINSDFDPANILLCQDTKALYLMALSEPCWILYNTSNYRRVPLEETPQRGVFGLFPARGYAESATLGLRTGKVYASAGLFGGIGAISDMFGDLFKVVGLDSYYNAFAGAVEHLYHLLLAITVLSIVVLFAKFVHG